MVRAVLMTLIVVLAGCAQSPQQLSFNGELTPANIRSGLAVISVQARDDRASMTVGSRGGTYAETSLLTTNKGFAQQLADQYQQGLIDSGVITIQPSAPTAITVVLSSFAISTPERSVLPEISYAGQLSVVAERGGEKRSFRYSVKQTHKMPQVPNNEKNQALVDDLFSELLNRALRDQDLNGFIVGG
ncbi:hypothetical protein SIN8267_01557 [Sinobacterium norvegicum]|uniref:Lipoprotein n=1 Tax=Sinobacterium norvegicum TaxID=1641715 RepID=A0ABN8EMW9_9GAMM|nr:YajG family lipoprotein [Sinobacterium norvegicum]CAH0991451.1 hypothetical protein SIN8267_01557 [Sinobacterium norvegicum]